MVTLTRVIASGGNDGTTGYGDLDNFPAFGNYYGDTTTRTFLRFDDVTIPAGSTVTAATLTLRSDHAETGAVRARFACEDADDPAAPTTASDLMARSLTTARSPRWTLTAADWNAGGLKVTTDFAAAVQEVVDRPGWASANALMVVALDDASTSPYANAISYESDPTEAALLTVTYDPPVVSDTDPPTVTLADPTPPGETPGYEHVSGTIDLQATASDDVAVTAVDVHADGALIATLPGPPFSAAWDTTTVEDGRHTLTAVARDAAGNEASAEPVEVIVSNDGIWAGPGLPVRTVHP